MRTLASPPKNQKGNILFLILLAVVLFAALAYAVTSSMRGGGKDAGSEKASAMAGEMMNYFTQIDTAVQRMMLTGGIKDYELNFYYKSGDNIVSGTYDNVNCIENRCRVFDPEGGGVNGRVFPSFIRDNGTGGGRARMVLTSVPGAGTSLPDLIMTFYGMRKDVCTEVNRQMGLNEYIYGAIGLSNGSGLYLSTPYPSGPFASVTNSVSVAQNVGIAGTFCVCAGSTPATCDTTDPFYPAISHVIIAR